MTSYKDQNIPPISHRWLVREAAHAALATAFFGYVPPLPLLDSAYDYREAAFSGFNNPVRLAQREQELVLWPQAGNVLTISIGTDICGLVPDDVGKDWATWSITDAYCAPYVEVVKKHSKSQSSRTSDVTDVVRQVIETAAETKGEHLKALDVFSRDSYYRVDPPLGLDRITFSDYFQRQAVKESIDRWATGTNGGNIIVEISKLVVEEKVAQPDDLHKLDPPSPPLGTVNPHYNPQLDKRRPETIMEYLR